MAKNVHDLSAIWVRFWESERITHFHPLSRQILSYNNIFDIKESYWHRLWYGWYKCLVLIQTCTKTIVDLNDPIWNQNNQLSKHITRVLRDFLQTRKIDRILDLCPKSSQICICWDNFSSACNHFFSCQDHFCSFLDNFYVAVINLWQLSKPLQYRYSILYSMVMM